MKMSEPRRLHPITALLSGLRALRELLLPLAILIISSLFRGGTSEGSEMWWRFGSAGAVLVGTLIFGVLSWSRYRYTVEEGELRIEHGVLVKKRNYIARQRIQAVDFTEPLLHRLFGVVKVTVETAGGQKPEAVLTAVTREEAEHLKQELMFIDVMRESSDTEDTLHHGGGDAPMQVEREPDFLYELPSSRLFIYGATSGGIGVVLSLFAAAFSQAGDVIPYEQIFSFFNHFVFSALLMLTFVVLFVAWVLGMLGVMIKYGGFVLKKSGDRLLITRGWIERRQLTIPVKRVQAVRLVEGVLRQPFGFVSVQIDTAGYGAVKGEKTIIFPLLRRAEVRDLLEEVLPGFYVETRLTPLPKRSAIFYMLGWALPVLIVSIPSFYFLTGMWRYTAGPLLLLAALLGVWQHRSGGFAVKQRETLVLRSRFISRTTTFIPRRRIQFARLRTAPWQRPISLASYTAVVASGQMGAKVTLYHMKEDDGHKLYEWVQQNTNATE